jgi:transcriptional regulator with XRE-family HTH domain
VKKPKRRVVGRHSPGKASRGTRNWPDSSAKSNYLATVEIGGKFPSAETLEKLAVALGLKPYQLFLEEGDVEAFDRTELVVRYRDRAEGYLVEALGRAARELATFSVGT